MPLVMGMFFDWAAVNSKAEGLSAREGHGSGSGVKGEEQNISFLVVARAAALRRVERRPAALGRTALIAP